MTACQKVKRALLTAVIGWSPVVCIVLAAGLTPTPAGALDLLVGSGESGTFSHFTARIIERVVNKAATEINCKSVPSSGDVHNLTNLSQGSLDMALVDSRMLHDAINKRGNFQFLDIRYDNLKVVLPLYSVPLTLLARTDADIADLDALKGKRINAGLRRSPRHLATTAIMAAKQWQERDFSLFGEISTSLSQDTMAFCHGTIQAMVHIGVHPDPSVQQLLQRCDAKLIGINDAAMQKLADANSGWTMTTIAGNTYAQLSDQMNTLASQTLLVASAELDEQSVYAVIEALFNNTRRFQSAHPALLLKPVVRVDENIAGAALHTGAIRYFSRP